MRRFGGTWSESKLDCVERYLTRYLQVMQRQSWSTLHYVDAFAGRGRQALKDSADTSGAIDVDSFLGDASERADTEEFLVGSALRAMTASTKSTRPFDRFVFVDSDEPSCRELDQIISEDFPALRPSATVRCEDANSALAAYIAATDWAHVRAVVFLDPYGMEVDWSTLERLAATAACDVWYLFPLGGVIRMMTRNGQIPEDWRTQLDRVLGTPEWFDEFYRSTGQRSLLDDIPDTQFRDVSPRTSSDTSGADCRLSSLPCRTLEY